MALCGLVPGFAGAQSISDFVPPGTANCDVRQPPAEAGLIVTPGGLVLVYPRSAALHAGFTGCKLLWIAETNERYLKLATLYFKNGRIALAASHDFRNDPERVEAACAFPPGKSLLPQNGRRITDEGCAGFAAEDLYALVTPSWPRQCAREPGAKICSEEPR